MKNKDKKPFLLFEALKFFIENPYEEIYLREFSRKLGISPNSAQRFLEFFLRQNFVIEFKKANLRYFKANLESVTFRNIKKTFIINKIESSGLLDYFKNKCFNLVLFGSSAKGLSSSESDIDLVFVGNSSKKDLNLIKYEKKLGKEINLHVFSLSEWEKQKKENKAFYHDVISTGINLIGEMPI